MSDAIPTVQSRPTVRCKHCRIVQFVRASEFCARCKQSYAAQLHPEPEPQPVKTIPVVEMPVEPVNIGILPRRVKELRLERGYSQSQLAKIIGCPRTYVSKVEGGKCGPTFDSIERFAAALKVAPVAFVGVTRGIERDPFLLELAALTPLLQPAQCDYVLDKVRAMAMQNTQ